MKILLISLTLLISASTFAQSTLLIQDTYNRRTVTTNGIGKVEAKPDMAELNLQVTTNRMEALASKQEVDKRVNEFLSALKKFKIADKDIVASNLSTRPRYEHDRTTGRQRFSGYEASRTLQVTVRKLDQLSNIMDVALAQDIQGIQNINYKSSKEDQLRQQAQRMAVENSKARARELAEAYDAELGPILRINYQGQTPILMDPRGFGARFAAARPEQQSVYLTDTITFKDSVYVVFDLIIKQ